MYQQTRSLLPMVALGFVVVAILGYVAGVAAKGVSGNGHPRAAPVQQARPASTANVLLESSSGWQQSTVSVVIPGLTISHAVVFAPPGRGSQAGLLTGQLPAGEPSPLPRQFVASLGRLPETQVVNLAHTEAFRYSGLSLPGFARSLRLYAIPSPGANPAVLACYAPAGLSAEMRTCEGIVSSIRLVGQANSYNLTPDPTYAQRVSSSVGPVDRLRVALRREMHLGASLAVVQRQATRLAAGFGEAVASLDRLEPVLVAGQAQAALSRALVQARDAYAALAAAAGAEELSAYETARSQVGEAEANVNTALASFAMLGYAHP